MSDKNQEKKGFNKLTYFIFLLIGIILGGVIYYQFLDSQSPDFSIEIMLNKHYISMGANGVTSNLKGVYDDFNNSYYITEPIPGWLDDEGVVNVNVNLLIEEGPDRYPYSECNFSILINETNETMLCSCNRIQGIIRFVFFTEDNSTMDNSSLIIW